MYRCKECGYTVAKPYGVCPRCKTADAFVPIEVPERAGRGRSGSSRKKGTITPSTLKALADVRESEATKKPTGIETLDIVTGGGLVPGGVYLLAGNPGSGKSTLATMAALKLSKQGHAVYISGEETAEQFKMRASRLSHAPEIQGDFDYRNLLVDDSRNIIAALEAARLQKGVVLAVVDSIQSVVHPEVSSAMGSIAQVRAAVDAIIGFAKSERVPTLIIGQVTKDNDPAGPKQLEHWVDAVLNVDFSEGAYRVVKPSKHRFGTTDVAALFEMTQTGARSITNPSMLFVERKGLDEPGVAIGSHLLGETVGLLLMVEAQVSPMRYQYPARDVFGLPPGAFRMLVRAAERLELGVGGMDVAVKVWGGMTSRDYALELAVVAAMISSAMRKPWGDTLFVGSVSLSGLVTDVMRIERRVRDGLLNGISRIVVPAGQYKRAAQAADGKAEVIGVSKIGELVKMLRHG